jgi:hypothetical protein
MAKTLEEAVARFGGDVRAKLNDPSAVGEPEDQLRGPLENLIADINALIGKAGGGIKAIGEVRLPDLMTRPDYAVTRDGLIGFIEVKAPGKGSDPTAFPAKSADRLQWEKLKSLPNILYTDGNGFTLWRNGKRVASAFVKGDVRTAGSALTAGKELIDIFSSFYDWSPIAPSKPRQLAETAARLCRLLRAQVVEQLARDEPRLTSLKADWGKLLFPEADDDAFADGYFRSSDGAGARYSADRKHRVGGEGASSDQHFDRFRARALHRRAGRGPPARNVPAYSRARAGRGELARNQQGRS